MDLKIFRSEIHGVFHIAQVQWHIQRARMALKDDLFEVALDALRSLARIGTEAQLSTAAWRELLLQASLIAVTQGLKDGLGAFFEQYAWLAWSGSSQDSMPWELNQVFAQVPGNKTSHAAAAYLGDLLARSYPECALGFYSAAHFRELERMHTNDLHASHMLSNAERFARAALLARTHRRSKLARHCTLRHGVALLLGGEKAQGRTLLRKIEVSELTQREQLWYALGMTQSEFWLDRVRAADTLDDLARTTDAMQPSRARKGTIKRSELRDLVYFLFERDVLELHAVEQDRLEALVDELFEGSEQRQMRRTLTMHVHLQESLQEPIPQAAKLANTFVEESHDLGPRWAHSAQSFRLLQSLSDPFSTPQMPRKAKSPFLHIAYLTAKALDALRCQDDGALELALHMMRNSWSTRSAEPKSAHMRTIALIWPPLLERFTTKKEQKEHTPPQENRDDCIKELVVDIIRLWTPMAPTPSYGWWSLSAHLIQAKMHIAAHATAQRALMTKLPDGQEDLRDHVIGKMIVWSIDEGNRILMSRWLEEAERLYGPK